MTQETEERIQRLLDQLNDPSLTKERVDLIERKLEVLKQLE